MQAQRNDPAPVDEQEAALHESGVGRVLLEREGGPRGHGEAGGRGERRVELPTALESAGQRDAGTEDREEGDRSADYVVRARQVGSAEGAIGAPGG